MKIESPTRSSSSTPGTQSPMAFVSLRFLLLLLPFAAASSWRIEKGGTITTNEQGWPEERKTPPNTADPDHFRPTAAGGSAQRSGSDGAVVFVAHVHAANPTQFETVDVPPMELRAQYFVRENVVQTYVVPGYAYGRPYMQEVRAKVWGAGGGGCNGGEFDGRDLERGRISSHRRFVLLSFG